jgi:hypothetical protein
MWGKLRGSLDLSGYRRKIAAYQRAAAVTSTAYHAFWAVFFSSVMPSFFEDMFDARGAGGEFKGRSWKPLSDAWLKAKEQRGWDPRMGHRFGDLRDALTDDPLVTYTGARATWGTNKLTDQLSGRSYASFFNALRPIIDDRTAEELRRYIREDRKRDFDNAVRALKEAITREAGTN